MGADSVESAHSSKAKPRYEFQLSFASSTSVDRPCFVLPSEGSRGGSALSATSSLFLSYSDRKSLLQFDLQEQAMSSIADFDASLTSLSVFPSSPHLLATQEKRAFILDPREKLVVASVLSSRSVTSSALSCSPFQLYSILRAIDRSFLSGANGIDVFDSRMLCRPHSQIRSSSSLCLVSHSPSSLVQVTTRRRCVRMNTRWSVSLGVAGRFLDADGTLGEQRGAVGRSCGGEKRQRVCLCLLEFACNTDCAWNGSEPKD